MNVNATKRCINLIHRFIKYQDEHVSGLTETARNVRRRKNKVTMKFNLVNFVLETTSILLLLAVKTNVIRILYLLVRYKYLQGQGFPKIVFGDSFPLFWYSTTDHITPAFKIFLLLTCSYISLSIFTLNTNFRVSENRIVLTCQSFLTLGDHKSQVLS